jgi:hypothetical protein
VGSMFVMTENVFRMVDAWEDMTRSVVVGLHSINKFVAANPKWRMLEIFDWFNAHLLSHNDNGMQLNAKSISLKEEGDISHDNQSYDKHVAKDDKHAKTDSISLMRSEFKFSKTIICDHWSLVNIGCYAVPDTTREVWTSSFEACNLDPCTQVTFVEWCQQISHFLQTGKSFKEEAFDTEPSTEDIYEMLPSFWHTMVPTEKKAISKVI